MAEAQRIAVVGAGAIGSAFAFHLARAGHEVTVIARGARLAALQQEVAIVTTQGERAAIRVEPALPPRDAFDLVIVAVLGWQVDELLATLAASRARAFLFVFNAFEGLERIRDAVGQDRFGWAFPAIAAKVIDQRLDVRVVPRALAMLQITTLGAMPDFTPTWMDAWRNCFAQSGIPSAMCADMPSWLATHAAFMAPLMTTGVCVHTRGVLTAEERRTIVDGWRAAFALVRRRGHAVTPMNMAMFSHLPAWFLRLLLRIATRLPQLKYVGANGPNEARWLFDAMLKGAPDPAIERVRALLEGSAANRKQR